MNRGVFAIEQARFGEQQYARTRGTQLGSRGMHIGQPLGQAQDSLGADPSSSADGSHVGAKGTVLQ